MMPRYLPGEMIFVERLRPARIGQDVLVTTFYKDDIHHCVLGRLADRSRDGVRLEILNPQYTIEIAAEDVDAIDPLLSSSELLEWVPLPDAYA